ncbi:unnamed protein product [Caenorhabditis angaria]|uniref:Uncharacterized protein n=1 Tax=Caenorhabditis angaria TaxID=860376 RepID=A0A9P1N385_9PELO|nr:unnamed protein product [Caenorhabditis angaria]
MVEISLGVLFRGFNASKFILYTCLLTFVALVSLKLDNIVTFNYAFVFAPLWACNLLVFLAALIGICSFCTKPPATTEISMRVDFHAMIITTTEHIFLFVFLVMTFVKLEFSNLFDPNYPLPWTIVFCPLFGLSILSIVIAIWSLRHEKPFEFEFFYAINIVELVFIAFKLDKQVDWSWAVVFIPLWAVLSISAVGVLYALVLSIVLARSRHFIPSHRRQHVYSAVFHTFLVLPALVCLVLLTGKLDSMQWNDKESADDLHFTTVFGPLMISLFFMTLMSLGIGGPPSGASMTNIWWFGLRQPLCPFLLEKCPSLRTYANVSYRLGSRRETNENTVEERQAVINNTPEDQQDEPDSSTNSSRRKDRSSTQNDPEIAAASSSTIVRQAMEKYRTDFAFHYGSELNQPD